MKRALAQFFTVLAAVLLLFSMLFFALKITMNDRTWYLNEYTRLGTAKSIGMSNTDVTDALMRLIDYMEGRVDSIQLKVKVNGKSVKMYNERETEHMLDVRTLYQGAQRAAVLALPAAAVLCLFAALLTRRGERLTLFTRGYLVGAGIFAAVVIALGIFALFDFTTFWTMFHKVFFTNDLWLLDPATDRMILICPEQMFYDLVMRFGGRFLIAAGVLLAVCVVFLSVKQRRRRTPLTHVNAARREGGEEA